MIRQFKDKDRDSVVTVWREASDFAHPFLSKEFQDKEASNVRDVYPQFAKIWVKTIEDNIVGFIAMIESEVGAIFVSPACHGQGIGRQLMDFVIETTGRVTLDVFEKNHVGRRFYDRYGFKSVGKYRHEATGQIVIKLTFQPEA